MDSLLTRLDDKLDNEISIEAESLEILKAIHAIMIQIRERLEQ